MDSTVVFNEIMYHPNVDESGGAVEADYEWIELHNQLRVDMDISEWELKGEIDYTFPDGTVVPGNGYIVVAKSPTTMDTELGFSQAFGPFTGRLSNGGGEIELWNNDERLMNVINYGDNGDWPVGPDGGGVSLAKRDGLTATEDSENWTVSFEMGGSPGAANYVDADDVTIISDTILASNAPVTAFVPTNNSLQTQQFLL